MTVAFDLSSPGNRRPHVVIIGGGFGGLRAARSLAKAPVRLTLLDRKNHHVFQPLLYQVASAGLSAAEIAYPIRAALRRQRNARVLLADAVAIDLAARRVVTDGGPLAYDTLIVATGTTHSYFGKDEWAAVAPGLKTIDDALEIRRRIFTAYEAAEREADPARQREWLTFAIVGAGATGVELAGILAEIAHHTLKRDFRAVDPQATRIVLIEGVDRVLPSFPPDLSAKAERQLVDLGVEVMTGQRVTQINAFGLEVGGAWLPARTVLWAAGVSASPLARTLGTPLDRAGRVIVEPDLSVPGHPEVFVVGDLAAATSDGEPVPGLAPAAMQGGLHAARCVKADLAGKPRPTFRYRDKGSLATIGRSAAVANLGRLHFGGFFAWLAWWGIHIAFLIGFRNRTAVMLGWMWSYLTFQRGARLITGPPTALPPISGYEHPAPPGTIPQAPSPAAAQADEPPSQSAPPPPGQSP